MASKPTSRLTVFRGIVGGAILVAALTAAKAVIVPMVLAVLITFVLTPLVIGAQRCGLKRVPAVLTVATLTGLGGLGLTWGVWTQVSELAQDLPRHKAEIRAKIANLKVTGDGTYGALAKMFHEVEDALAGPDEATSPVEGTREKVVTAVPRGPSAIEQISDTASRVAGPLASAGLVVVLVIFMLVRREDLRNRFIALLGHAHLTGTTRALVDAARRLSGFLLAQVAVNAGFGTLFGAGLLLLGVPYALLWGFLTALFRFVPFIGGLMALSFPLLLSVAVSPGWLQPALIIGWFVFLQLISGNVIEPLLFGRSTGVTPIALLAATAFWAWAWGPIGLILSTPLTVCLVVLGQHVPRLQFLTLLLGDRPPLQPHVSYYQRLVAEDRREAMQVTAECVRLRGWQVVYDEVLLPALVLARRDRKRSGLSASDEEFILRATAKILKGLGKNAAAATSRTADSVEGQANKGPQGQLKLCLPETSRTSMVLGFPSHHPAESLSIEMLGQLLDPHAFQVEAMSTRSLPSALLARVKSDQPAVVCIAVLPPSGRAQAMYLCRKLRKRYPELPIIVGYWGRVRDFDRLLVRFRAAGASYVTTTLLQTATQVRSLVPPAPSTVTNGPPS